MASRTGTESQVDASAASGSTSVTVPADATAVVALWAHFRSGTPSTLGSLTLGGNAFTTRAEVESENPDDQSGTGVATLVSLPAAGSQTLAWAWSDGIGRSEGGGIFLIWVKDVDTSDLVRDANADSEGGASTINMSLTTVATDLVLVLVQSFFSDSDPVGPATVFLDNIHINQEGYDLSDVTAESPTTDVGMDAPGSFPTVTAIALKNGTVAPPVTDESPYRHNVTPMTWR